MVWLLLSLILVTTRLNSFSFSVVAYVCMLAFSYWIAEQKLEIGSKTGKKIRYSVPVILYQGDLQQARDRSKLLS